METRQTEIGNIPDVRYALQGGDNELYIAYREFDLTPSWLFISISNPSKALIDSCRGIGKLSWNIDEPKKSYLYLDDSCQTSPGMINLFIDKIKDYYHLDESIRCDIKARVDILSEKNNHLENLRLRRLGIGQNFFDRPLVRQNLREAEKIMDRLYPPMKWG